MTMWNKVVDINRETTDVFATAREKLGDAAFLRHREGKPVGALPPAYFESISIGLTESLDQIKHKDAELLRTAITELVQSQPFRAVTGPGANSREKLESRIELAKNKLLAA